VLGVCCVQDSLTVAAVALTGDQLRVAAVIVIVTEDALEAATFEDTAVNPLMLLFTLCSQIKEYSNI
jgi:hypothetical protein